MVALMRPRSEMVYPWVLAQPGILASRPLSAPLLVVRPGPERRPPLLRAALG